MPFSDEIVRKIRELGDLNLATRAKVFNQVSRALACLVHEIDAPALGPQLLPAEKVRANDYNPNKVASPEMDLLEQSIRCDGVTMCVVVHPEEDGTYTVVDGFHRRSVIVDRLGDSWIPCSVIERSAGDRMASTIRHNRARGKHQVDLMGALVRALMAEGWEDPKIAEHLGMSEEELLRLKQIMGAARLLAGEEYGSSYGRTDEPPEVP